MGSSANTRAVLPLTLRKQQTAARIETLVRRCGPLTTRQIIDVIGIPIARFYEATTLCTKLRRETIAKGFYKWHYEETAHDAPTD